MTVLNFPPTAGEPTDGSFTYTANGIIYSWDGEKWNGNTEAGLDTVYVQVAGDTMTGDLNVETKVITGDLSPWTDPSNLSGSYLEAGYLLQYRNITNASGAFHACYDGNGGSPVFEVKTDGSATFDGNVTVGNTSPTPNSNEGGSTLFGGSGGLRLYRSVSGSGASASNVIDILNNGNEVFSIDTDGAITSQDRDVPTFQTGTWVPASSSGTLTPSSSNWTRIGNLVTLKANLASFSVNATSDPTGTDAISIISLPYNVSLSQAAGSCMYLAAKPGYTTVYVTSSSTHNNGILQFYNTNDANAWDILKYSNLDPAASFYITATYITDDTTWTPENGAVVS